MTSGAFSLTESGQWELNDQGKWQLKCPCWYVAVICSGADCPGGQSVQVPCAEVQAHRNFPGDIFFRFGGVCYTVNGASVQVDTQLLTIANLSDSDYASCEECCAIPPQDLPCPSADWMNDNCPMTAVVAFDITFQNGPFSFAGIEPFGSVHWNCTQIVTRGNPESTRFTNLNCFDGSCIGDEDPDNPNNYEACWTDLQCDVVGDPPVSQWHGLWGWDAGGGFSVEIDVGPPGTQCPIPLSQAINQEVGNFGETIMGSVEIT